VLLDRTYVGGTERGERNLSLVNIETIAQTFKTSHKRNCFGVCDFYQSTFQLTLGKLGRNTS